MRALTANEVRKAAAGFRAATSLGAEGLHPRALTLLSDQALEAFIALLIECSEYGHLPDCASFVIAKLIPKPSGGHRAIGLYAAIYRVWGALARRAIEPGWLRYGLDNKELVAGPGCSAGDPAWRAAVAGQVAKHIQDTHGQGQAQPLVALLAIRRQAAIRSHP